jgi:hypothetical protein
MIGLGTVYRVPSGGAYTASRAATCFTLRSRFLLSISNLAATCTSCATSCACAFLDCRCGARRSCAVRSAAARVEFRCFSGCILGSAFAPIVCATSPSGPARACARPRIRP